MALCETAEGEVARRPLGEGLESPAGMPFSGQRQLWRRRTHEFGERRPDTPITHIAARVATVFLHQTALSGVRSQWRCQPMASMRSWMNNRLGFADVTRPGAPAGRPTPSRTSAPSPHAAMVL